MTPHPRDTCLSRLNLTPEQALAVFEFLDLLRDEIWARYRTDIQAAMREQTTEHDPRQLRLDHIDLDPPF
jgi:hypothetical protein